MERSDQMKKIYIKIFFLIMMLSNLVFLAGCQKDENQEIGEAFIRTQINCGTYITSAGDEEVLKKVFLEFFTEETYQQYLEDAVGYFYPQLFYMLNADESNIHKIKCTKEKENADGTTTYEFTVKYTLVDLDEDQKKAINTVKLEDYLQISVNGEHKITKVIILNTSDIIKKLFLDIKVQ